MGFLAGVFGLSSVIGPTLGGFITDNFSWNWVFYINIPFGILIMILFIFFFPHIRPGIQKHRVDYGGIVTTHTYRGTVYAGPDLGPVLNMSGCPSPSFFLFAFSVAMLLLFIIIESRAEEPILPLWDLQEPGSERGVDCHLHIGFWHVHRHYLYTALFPGGAGVIRHSKRQFPDTYDAGSGGWVVLSPASCLRAQGGTIGSRAQSALYSWLWACFYYPG